MLQIAEHLGIETCEREVDLTELYIADEVFACGTSTYIAPVIEVDARVVNGSQHRPRHGQDQRARTTPCCAARTQSYGRLVTPLT